MTQRVEHHQGAFLGTRHVPEELFRDPFLTIGEHLEDIKKVSTGRRKICEEDKAREISSHCHLTLCARRTTLSTLNENQTAYAEKVMGVKLKD
ncbi:hypothetical protein TNCV_1148471 [Trichonephila clavipes]|nr:hypothetical protein TNCV_1148471 [Trichonephila clavipes]